MDGRRNDQGSPAPNADLYSLKLRPSYGYEWQMVDLDPSSNVPRLGCVGKKRGWTEGSARNCACDFPTLSVEGWKGTPFRMGLAYRLSIDTSKRRMEAP